MLSSSDPERVLRDFVTLDLLSSGRAELMAGRGSFTESFPLFGYSPGHPERVADKIAALARTLGLQRFEMHAPHVGHAATMRSIELFGTQVAPLLAERRAPGRLTSWPPDERSAGRRAAHARSAPQTMGA